MTPFILISLAWKSATVSGLALLSAKLCERHAPTDRALILKMGIGCLLLLPLLASFLPAVRVSVLAFSTYGPLRVARAAAMPSGTYVAAGMPVGDTLSELLSLFYQAGVAVLILQFMVGLALLTYWTATARELTSGDWYEVLAHSCNDARRPKLLVSANIHSPLSWGLFRPAILVDRQSLGQPNSAAAILAHELAHIRSRDWLMLILARLSAALFWFNPLVWLLVRAVERQMEEVADQAAEQVGAADYAQILVLHGRRDIGRAIPALAMAARPSRLSHRVSSLLRDRTVVTAFRTRGKLAAATTAAFALSLVATLAFVGGRAASASPQRSTVQATSAVLMSHPMRLYGPIAVSRTEERSGRVRWTSVTISSRQRSSAKGELDTAAQMDRQAAMVDDQAAEVEAQARTLRSQSSAPGLPARAREQAEQQAAALESAAAAMRISAAGTRANAIVTRRNRPLAQAP